MTSRNAATSNRLEADALDKIKLYNDGLLESFEVYLKRWILHKPQIVKMHVDNAYLYITEYLCLHRKKKAENGLLDLDDFFQSWFPKKAKWGATVETVEQTVDSIQRFYSFMHYKGLIEQHDIDSQGRMIAQDYEVWLDEMR